MFSGFSQVARAIAFAEAESRAIKQTRSDMLCALAFFKAMRKDRIALTFQPVLPVNGGQPLYYETRVAQLTEAVMPPVTCVDAIQALERLHLIERLDTSALWTVIETLEAHPELHLSCQVSVLSLQGQGWWKAVLSTLENKPDLAARLIVKIAEITTVFDIKEAASLLDTLRQFGCRIALDDIGAGYSTQDLGSRIRPDIIKIGKSIVHAAREPDGVHIFQVWVNAAQQIGQCIVVEGVALEGDLQRSVTTGAHGVQGSFMELDPVQPAWLAEPVSIQDRFNPAYFSKQLSSFS